MKAEKITKTIYRCERCKKAHPTAAKAKRCEEDHIASDFL